MYWNRIFFKLVSLKKELPDLRIEKGAPPNA
jgi:hypothetical protein